MPDTYWQELAGTLFEEAGDALFLFDPQTEQLREVNPMAQRLSGLSRRELLDLTVTRLIRSDVEGGLQRLRQAFRRTGLFHSQEGFWLKHKRDGVWVPINLTVTRLHSGTHTYGLATARDISERREAHALLLQAEAELRRVMASVTDCLWSAEVTPAGQWVFHYMSPVVERISGRPPEFYCTGPKQWNSIVHPDDRARFEDAWAQVRAGADHVDEEYRILRPDGAVRWVRDSVVVTPGPDGRSLRLDGVVTDVTERRQADEALRDSEARHRLLLEQMPAILWTTDTDLRITSSTGAGLSATREKPNESKGHLLADLIANSEAFDVTMDAHRRALRGEAVSYETGYKDHAWQSHVEPLRDAAGVVTGTIGCCLDVTAQVQIREALRASEARHRLMLERMPAVLWTTDRDIRITSTVGSALTSLGILPNSNCGKNYQELLGTDDPDALPIPQHRRALKGDSVSYEMDAFGRSWQAHVEPLRDADGNIIGVIGCSLDITAQLQARDALRASEAKYRSLIENLTQAIFLKDRDLKYLVANKPFCQSVARGEEEIVGVDDFAIYPPHLAEKYRATDRLVIQEGRRLELEEQNLIDGRLRTVQKVKTPVLDDQGHIVGVLGIFWDVTDQRNLEAQLRQAHKMEAVGQLAGGIAHDFNNLLTGILGNLSLAIADLPKGHSVHELLANAEVATLRAAELTRQLLGFSRRTPLRSETHNLNVCIEETVRLLRRTFDPRIRVDVRACPGLWPVQADASQMGQVLMNLCLNARDAMPEGGTLTLSTENVSISADAAARAFDGHAGDFVHLRVRDTGVGMPSGVQDRIFEPFFTTKEPGKGTGLGLAMVFGIIKQHQGWIECKSAVNQGTTFDVYLPRLADAAPAPTPPPAAAGVAGGKELILLVDDEEVVGRLGLTILERHGYRVLSAMDGAEAVEIYRARGKDIDLVILDLAMPRLSGSETLRELRKLNPAVPVLISSGYSSDDDLRAVEKAGVLGFVAKPYLPADLARRVRESLDQVRAASGA